MTPPPVPDHLIPRVVFFGPSRSGKTALIRRLIQLANPSRDTALSSPADAPANEIQRELVPHLISVPAPVDGPGSAVIVCDCDGQSAGELLSHPDKLIRGAARGALASAVRTADTLVLIVDAAALPIEVDRIFRAFGGFLECLSEGRTFGREVGGLPVFLTLTKCDELAQSGDKPGDWLNRIEARKAEVQKQFHDFFGDDVVDRDSPYLDFGSIDLHVNATAVEVPKLQGVAVYADPDGTFGIAQLAQQVLPEARTFRKRTLLAKRRLRTTLTGLGLLVGIMLAGVIGFAAVGIGDPLAARVRLFQEQEGPPAVRLAARNLTRNLNEITAIRNSAGFAMLSSETREFIESRLAEYTAYSEYRKKLLEPRLTPPDIRTQRELADVTATLETDLTPPPKYAATWTDTEAVKLRAKWQTDVTLLREAEDRLHDWYRGLIRRANQELLTTRPLDSTWRQKSVDIEKDGNEPPFDPKKPIPGSPTLPIRQGAALTYFPAFEFDRIDLARRDWIDTRDKLTALRNFSDVLGFTTGPDAPPPLLDLPDVINEAERTSFASQRLRELAAAFPNQPLKHPEWQTDHFPDPVREWLKLRLRSRFTKGISHMQRLLVERLPADRLEDWQKLANEALTEEPLRDWGVLLGLLRRWDDPTAPDPVQELAAFLKQSQFEFNPKSIEVAIPDDLLGERLIPKGNLLFTFTPTGGTETELAFRQDGEPRLERPLTVFTFVPTPNAKPISIRPGDKFTAKLSLRAGSQEYRLVWASPRSAVYSFDALAQPPMLERTGAIPSPQRATGVRLIAPNSGIPLAPVLLPAK